MSVDVTRPTSPEPGSRKPDSSLRSTRIQPLSEHSYRVVFTASQRLKEKMDLASELASHAVSPRDLPALLERALDLLIVREERRRYGAPCRGATAPLRQKKAISRSTEAVDGEFPDVDVLPPVESHVFDPTASSPPDTAVAGLNDLENCATCPDHEVDLPRRRYLSARIRRQVWERDEGQCSYVNAEGRRCQSRHLLEFDHRVAHALGGPPTVDNIRLRCRAHNTLAAEQIFGTERIADAIVSSRERQHRAGRRPVEPDSTGRRDSA